MQALLVLDVDYANFWKPEDIAINAGKQRIVSEIRKNLDHMRLASIPIIFVITPKGYSGNEFQLEPRRSCMACGWHGFGRQLSVLFEHNHHTRFEPVFVKNSPNAFSNPHLETYLQSLNITEILLAGCSTFACILDTARGSLLQGHRLTLLRDCIYTPFRNEQEETRWIKRVSLSSRPLVRIT